MILVSTIITIQRYNNYYQLSSIAYLVLISFFKSNVKIALLQRMLLLPAVSCTYLAMVWGNIAENNFLPDLDLKTLRNIGMLPVSNFWLEGLIISGYLLMLIAYSKLAGIQF